MLEDTEDIVLIETKMSDKIKKNNFIILNLTPLRHVFEDHMNYIRERSEPHKVEPIDTVRFKHDLNGYLMSIGIPPGYHWCYMRVNDMKYPWEFDESTEILLFPPNEVINELVSQYASIK